MQSPKQSGFRGKQVDGRNRYLPHTICLPMNSVSAGYDVTTPVWNNAKEWQMSSLGMDALIDSG